jgi:hypothetical protein
VKSDDLQVLIDFRNKVPAPDEATAERIYRLATTSRVTRRRPFDLLVVSQLVGRKRLIALCAAAAVACSLAGVLLAITLSAAPASAYAAAKKAIAASSAGALDSGTMTQTTLSRSPDGSTSSVTVTARWNRKDIAIASEGGRGVIPGFEQLLLVAGAVYLQRADGSWLHYASESVLESPPYAGTVQAVHGLVAGNHAAQIIASTYGLDKTVQPDGSTVYSGTIPPANPAEVAPSGDKARQLMQLILPGFGPGGTFRLVVGSDGLVKRMSETAAPPITASWSIEYSQLGSTPPITPPASYTEGTPGDLPTLSEATVPSGTDPLGPRETAQQQRTRLADELSFARCMRSRGVSRFPDPTAQGCLSVEMVQAQGIDVHSPAVLRVVQACLPASHGALTLAKVEEVLKNAGG